MPEDVRIERGLSRQFEDRRNRLAGSESHLGWKAGFGATAAMERLSLDGPLMGFLTSASKSNQQVSVDGWTKAVAEPEIAVYIDRDIEAGAVEGEIRNAVAAIGPAIELADIAFAPDDVEEILAGNIFHRGVIFGIPDPGRRGADLTNLTARISLNGSLHAETDELEAITGRIPDTLGRIAALLGSRGGKLQSGDVIICGSVVPPLGLRTGDRVDFELEGFEPVTVEAM